MDTNNKQKVSVIIPVYNGEHFIGRAIESVLGQTYKLFEVIVIDDGSTDGTLNILKGFEGRIRYKSVKNAGVSSARNMGISMAIGEFISFLDADDVWHKDKLEKQVNALAKFPEAGFCCCDYFIYDNYRRETVNHFTVLAGKQVNYNEPLRQKAAKLLLSVNFVGTASTVLLRRKIIEQVGVFNESYRQAEDFELWLRCATVTRFILLSDILVDKKSHTMNLTNNSIETHTFHKTVLENSRDALKGFLEAEGLVKDYSRAIAQTHYRLGNEYFRRGEYRDAFSSFWRGLKAHVSFRNMLCFVMLLSKKCIKFLILSAAGKRGLQKA